ncbi:MAG: hypothetical protein Q3M24_17705 [Candidatus Electrothrix aestuarii]|uniref:Uncharacterized protein n=1 Tax=Candidatus Electrothrix aestuarii TaxID=3062594 RepID=A0AAU8LSW3_9BACT|nr:hypothetical protein [Candidatus Electrothrix aestuarii]
MAITNYLAELQATRTYKEGVITAQEYNFISKFGGIYRKLPEIPKADDDRHIIVMEMLGNQPNIYGVLSDPKMTINPKSTDANRLLFIFVNIKPSIFSVSPPEEGYKLGDNHHISATFKITYRITDVKKFWSYAKDPIAMLETAITDEARNYFLGVRSNYLVRAPADTKKTLESHIDAEIKKIKKTLEESIKTNLNDDNSGDGLISGIEIIQVNAVVQLSDELNTLLKKLHEKFFGEGGVVDKSSDNEIDALIRRKVDERIDEDKTFAPYPLRNVIMSLDTGLLENFYCMDWSGAMRKVHDELSKQKKAHLEEQNKTLIDEYENRLTKAKKLELDERHILDLKDKLADLLMQDPADTFQKTSNNQFLQQRIDLTVSNTQLLSDDS